MMWDTKMTARDALSEPRAFAPAAVHGAGNDFRKQRVRSGSPSRDCLLYSQRLPVASSTASLPELAQPPKTMSHLSSLLTSPRVQFRPLPTSRLAMPKVESQFLPQKAKSPSSNMLKSDSAMPGFQQKLPQSISNANAQSQLVEHFQKFIRSELQACCEALTAVQETFMTDFMGTLEARLEANSCPNNLATKLGDLEKDVRKLESNLKETELRVGKVAFQQTSEHAERQLFETQMVGFFEFFEESLRGLHLVTSSSELQLASISRANTAECRNAVESILQGSGGQQHTLFEQSSAAPDAATGRCKHRSLETKQRQMTSPSPECRKNQGGSGSSTSWPGILMPETPFRIEALEVALASMQQQEQERICRLQERIRDLQKT